MTERSAPTGFRAAATPDLANSSGRIIRYIFSTPDVARDGHTIRAWDLANYLTNPVFLWAHDSGDLPIGRVIEIEDRQGLLTGAVEYADADLHPFADTVFRLVKANYLNATSVSWNPLKWKFSTDKARPGGIDFDLVDLLEISQVPVPALPGALATARAQGIDTGPIFQWAEKVLDGGGMLIVPRDELEELRRAAKMPTRTNDRPTADVMPIPTPVERDGIATVISQIEGVLAAHRRMTPAGQRAARVSGFRRDLYDLGQAAYLLASAVNLESCLEWEAEYEGDNSPLPAELAALNKLFGEWLKKLVVEEVDEAVGMAEEGARNAAPRADLARLGQGLQLLRQLDDGALGGIVAAMRDHVGGKVVTFRTADAAEQPLARAGKALSSANEEALRSCHEHMVRGCEMLREFIDGATASADDDADDTARAAAQTEQAARERRARAIKLKHSLAVSAA
ncbi:HK97 family phage prohead protease [Bradyrhizobium sp. HKCCYLRH3099]|uniref:HK97 family phage prohead protease n=1 Tax=unclassified Bradyrhizobium TaxID=2631580 RepID=UPI003EB84775